MSLDASVFCDCLEKHLLRTLPEPEWGVYLDDSGARTPTTTELNQQIAFDDWDKNACEHEYGILLHHHLRNISLIGLFRRLLEPSANFLPVVTEKVIYSGSHCGDHLQLADVKLLQDEIELLAKIDDPNPQNVQFLRDFEQQLRELIECAIRIGKPIAF